MDEVLDEPSTVTPADVACISACLRACHHRGKPEDYFDEAFKLIQKANEFLRHRETSSGIVDLSRSSKGTVGIVNEPTDLSAVEIIRPDSKGRLSFEEILKKRRGPAPEAKKGRSLMGALTTAKALRQLVIRAAKEGVVSETEKKEILNSEKISVQRLNSLIGFQNRLNKVRGGKIAASRKKKS
jgi:hypothetical protein